MAYNLVRADRYTSRLGFFCVQLAFQKRKGLMLLELKTGDPQWHVELPSKDYPSL